MGIWGTDLDERAHERTVAAQSRLSMSAPAVELRVAWMGPPQPAAAAAAAPRHGSVRPAWARRAEYDREVADRVHSCLRQATASENVASVCELLGQLRAVVEAETAVATTHGRGGGRLAPPLCGAVIEGCLNLLRFDDEIGPPQPPQEWRGHAALSPTTMAFVAHPPLVACVLEVLAAVTRGYVRFEPPPHGGTGGEIACAEAGCVPPESEGELLDVLREALWLPAETSRSLRHEVYDRWFFGQQLERAVIAALSALHHLTGGVVPPRPPMEGDRGLEPPPWCVAVAPPAAPAIAC
eukprot:COSAG01_NODE_4115_length_5335_cov_9.417494_3_plen_296_part_00